MRQGLASLLSVTERVCLWRSSPRLPWRWARSGPRSSAARNEASPQPAWSDLLSRQSSQRRPIGPGCGSREALPLGHTNRRRQMAGAAPSALLARARLRAGWWTGC